MGMTFAKHERIWLRQSPDFSESWLHDRISDVPSVLGLGALDVLERERVQRVGGRINMLLTDGENNARFEVEIMLGATDPSHIVRCISRRHTGATRSDVRGSSGAGSGPPSAWNASARSREAKNVSVINTAQRLGLDQVPRGQRAGITAPSIKELAHS